MIKKNLLIRKILNVFQTSANKSYRSLYMDHFISLCIRICNIGILPRYIICVVQCLLQKLSLEKKLR